MEEVNERWMIEERYKKWWVGKLVRPAGSDSKFSRVVDLHFIAPRSGVYGVVELKIEDGSREFVIPCDHRAFKPRKKDLEVKEE